MIVTIEGVLRREGGVSKPVSYPMRVFASPTRESATRMSPRMVETLGKLMHARGISFTSEVWEGGFLVKFAGGDRWVRLEEEARAA